MPVLTIYGQDAKSTLSGKITFQEKAKIEIKLEGDAAQFADNLPKEQVSTKLLYFNSASSIYINDETKSEEDIVNQESGTVKIKMISSGENDRIFCDLKDMKTTEEKEFMTRKFLVVGGDVKTGWKIRDNFSSILGYNCQEAVWEDSSRMVKAWFTTSIPVQSGPAGFGGLPGMILSADINNGKRIITATAIDQAADVTSQLVKPSEGKKVTREEFTKIVDEKRKEMGVENGDGANHIVIKYKN